MDTFVLDMTALFTIPLALRISSTWITQATRGPSVMYKAMSQPNQTEISKFLEKKKKKWSLFSSSLAIRSSNKVHTFQIVELMTSDSSPALL